MKLNSKLTIAFSIVVLIAVGLTTWATYSLGKQILIERTLLERKNNISTESEKFSAFVQSYQRQVELLSAFPLVRSVLLNKEKGVMPNKQYQELLHIFETQAGSDSNILQLRLLDVAGFEVVRVDQADRGHVVSIPIEELQNKGERNYFKETIKLAPGQVYISDLELNREHGKISSPYTPTLRIATPISRANQDDIMGVVIINLRMSAALNRLKNKILGDTILTDEEGNTLLHPNADFEFSKDRGSFHNYLTQNKLFKGNVLDHAQGEFIIPSEEVARIWDRIQFVPGVSSRYLILFSSISHETLLAPAKSFGKTLMLISFLTLALAAVLGSFLSRNLCKPLEKLSTAFKTLGEGEFNSNVVIEGTDEFSQLSEAFNSMVIRLRQTTASRDELFRSEAHYRGLFDNAADAIITIDASGTIRSANPATTEIFHYKESELLGSDFTTLFSGDSIDKSAGDGGIFSIDEAMLNNGSGSYRTCTGVTGQGVTFPMDATIGKVEIDSSPVYILIMRDISRHVELEEALKLATIAAEDANRAKSMFLANMSHEIRTPLNGIIGATELLERSNLDEKNRHYTELAKTSSQILLSLINDILDLSKIEAGKMELHSEKLELRELVERTIEIFGTSAFAKKISLGAYVDPSVPQIIQSDKDRLRQVLVNLLGNAVKFTDVGHVTLMVSSPSNNRIRFTVSDSGSGISEDGKTKLFKPFSQVDSSLTKKHAGTGLGLTISRQIVELMEGTIDVESTLNQGSTFWFEIPVTTIAHDQSIDTLDPNPNSGIKILLVDSNPAHASLVEAQLKSWGMRVVCTNTPTQAFQFIQNGTKGFDSFDVVIVDDELPDNGAVTLMSLINDDDDLIEQTKILMYWMGSDFATDRFREMGVSSFLPKPIRQSRLYDEVISAISKKRNYAFATSLTRSFESDNALFENKSILLAEDNVINQTVAEELLKSLGCTCQIAENGREAVRIAIEHQFDAILMDCQMPVMDGFEATQRIRDEEKKLCRRPTPIIALTANALKKDRELCLAVGMDGYLSKPLNFQKLILTLQAYFEQNVSLSPEHTEEE